MNLDIILNVIIAIAIYNMIIKSVALSVLKAIVNSDTAKEPLKSFKDKLKEKLE